VRGGADVLATGSNSKHSVKVSTKSAPVDLTMSSSLTDSVSADLKASYKAPAFSCDATFTSAQKVNASIALPDLAPGLSKTTLSFSVPDIKSGKLALDYSRASLSAKASMGLTATPKAECSVSTTMRDLTVGGEVGYDSKASAVSKWSVGAQYKLPSLVLAGILTDKGETVKASMATEVNGDITVGAEAVHKIAKGTTAFTLGAAAKLDGATVKAKIDNTGIASAMLETEVKPKAKMTFAGSFDALNLEKQPKVGIAMDIKA